LYFVVEVEVGDKLVVMVEEVGQGYDIEGVYMSMRYDYFSWREKRRLEWGDKW